MAWYQAGEFEKAAGAFGRTGSAEGMYNRGNALLLLDDYLAAIASYERALEMRTGWSEAAENLALARARWERLQKDAGERPDEWGTDLEPDEVVFDASKDKKTDVSEKVEVDEELLSEEQMRAVWLRRVETKPAEFLKQKFGYQYATRQNVEEGK